MSSDAPEQRPRHIKLVRRYLDASQYDVELPDQLPRTYHQELHRALVYAKLRLRLIERELQKRREHEQHSEADKCLPNAPPVSLFHKVYIPATSNLRVCAFY